VAAASPSGKPDLDPMSLIGRIASGLAHELNGPVGVAISFTALARETLASTEGKDLDPDRFHKLSEYLRLIEDAGVRARSLTRLMWSFANARPGAVEDFNLTDILARAADLATPALKAAQIDAKREERAHQPAVAHADPVLCLQSLVALLLESPSALPGGGTVVWRAAPNSDRKIRLTLRAQPWGEASTSPWAIPTSVESAFRAQGGSIQATTGPGERGHGVVGHLPAGDPASAAPEEA